MDFFESQDRAKRQTVLLLGLYLLAIAVIIVAIYAVTVLVFAYSDLDSRPRSVEAPWETPPFWDGVLFAWVAAGTLLVIGAGAGYRIMELRGHGGRVARLLGGVPVTPSSDDPGARRLINVVEEMAIASGMPVPEIFILENELGINAFAAGNKPESAAVAVTRGALDTLSRDELQGVIAHEFSHILNGDMRLNTRLMGLLNGILVIHVIGMIMLRSLFYTGHGRRRATSSGRGRGNGGILAAAAIALALTVIGYLGVIFARLIQSAVSRQREYLADAAAVQYTRNPEGISGALKKIGGLVFKGQVRSAHSVEAGHFFFANALSRSAANLFATHPPLRRRIRQIDPSFDGRFPAVKPAVKPESARPETRGRPQAARPIGGRSVIPGTPNIPIRLDLLLASIGTLGDAHRQRSAALLQEIPEPVRDAAHETLGAKAVIYLLLLSREETIRERQLVLLKEKADPRVLGEVEKLIPHMEALPAEVRLPLLDISLPALRELSPEQYAPFKSVVTDLIHADEQLSPFEFCLEKILFRRLDEHFAGPQKKIAQLHSFRAVAGEIALLFSALAHAGDKDTAKAFSAGIARVRMLAEHVGLAPEETCTPQAIGEALDRINRMTPPMKKRFLQGASLCVASDGKIAVAEGELLRTFAECLGCPMPPILGGEDTPASKSPQPEKQT